MLVLSAWWTIRLAWADHLSLSPQLADRQRAVLLAPAASLYNRLADKLEELGQDPLPALTQAAILDPASAERRMRLGLRLELARDFPLAERQLLQAASLSRLYQPRYFLAQYYFRRQNADAFFRWSRSAFLVAYGDVSPLLDLCWRMHPDPAWLRQYALPARPQIARQYLLFLCQRQQMGAAALVAGQISQTAEAEDLPALLEFCDRELAAGSAGPGVEIWNALCKRRLVPFEVLDPENGVSLTDGRFRAAALERGFDWHLSATSGLSSQRRFGELAVTFTGHQEEWCPIAWQFIPVRQGARYRLQAQIRGVDGTVPTGVCLKVTGLAGAAVPTELRSDGTLTFEAPAEVLRLSVSYQRPQGSPRLAGSVSITEVRLELER